MNASITFRLPPRFTFSLSTNQTFAHLTEGDFIARIVTANVSYAASPRLSFSNLIQYRQPLEQSRLAGPRAVDDTPGTICSWRSIRAGCATTWPICVSSAGQQAVVEAAVFVQILTFAVDVVGHADRATLRDVVKSRWGSSATAAIIDPV